MSLDEIKEPEIKFELGGETFNVALGMRNYAVLQEKYKISENEILKGFQSGDKRLLCFACWAALLEFYDENDPFLYREKLSLADITKFSLGQMQVISDKVLEAMQAFLPKPPEGGAPKKPQTKKKKKSSK